MKTRKQVLRPERLRTVPEQFSWVDQALVQHHLIDRCTSHSAALYLFLVTVADHQGLSYYGAATLASRLRLNEDEFIAARTQLIGLELIAWQAPLYQVLAVPTRPAPESVAAPVDSPTSPTPRTRTQTGPALSLAQLLELERRHAQL
jgi:hypothetical protein